MNILDRIVEAKAKEVELAKSSRGLKELESSPMFARTCLSMVRSLEHSSTGIIAEFKRASPSKGVINETAKPEEIARAYARYGAAGISVLTDQSFFGGSMQDLVEARLAVSATPLLRKDFIIDEYQLLEAKASGADVILLIAACLSPDKVQSLAQFAHSLGLEVLLEVHGEDELSHLCNEVDLVGVNNRNLKTFDVDIERSAQLAKKMPVDKPWISESGISDVDSIFYLRGFGFRGFLIGENFMKEPDPAIAFAHFTEKLTSTKTIRQ